MSIRKIAAAALGCLFACCLGAFGCGLFDETPEDNDQGGNGVTDGGDGSGGAVEEELPRQDEPLIIENNSIFSGNFCVKVNRVALSYINAADAVGGKIDEDKLFYGNLQSGNIYYMVTDITAQKAALTEDGGLKVCYEFSSNSAFSATLQETSTGNFKEYTAGDATRVEITFGLPDEKEEFTRRAIFRIAPKMTGEPLANITYSGEGVDTGSNAEIALPVCVGNYTKGLSFGFVDGRYTLRGTGSFKGEEIIVPQMHGGNIVTDIGERAFHSDEYGSFFKLKNVTVCDTVTRIGMFAFASGEYESITIPENIESIGYQAFAFCLKLKQVYFNAKRCSGFFNSLNEGEIFYQSGTSEGITVNFGKSVEVVPENLFGSNSADRLKAINFEEGCKPAIGAGAFSRCTKLTSVTFPEGIRSIGAGAFLGCHGLKSISIVSDVANIGDSAFYACEGLTDVVITSTAQRASVFLGNEVFSFCTALKNVTLGDSVSAIGESTFRGCNALQTFKFPSGVNEVSKNIFYGCDKLQSVAFGGKETKICEGAFAYCPQLTTIDIPDSVTEIEQAAFLNSKNLKNVTIGKGVRDIGKQAFFACPLDNLNFKVNWGWYTVLIFGNESIDFSNSATAKNALNNSNYAYKRL